MFISSNKQREISQLFLDVVLITSATKAFMIKQKPILSLALQYSLIKNEVKKKIVSWHMGFEQRSYWSIR